MLAPTSFKVRAICISLGFGLSLLFSFLAILSLAPVIINILSTPIAKTKNGTTSAEIKLCLTPNIDTIENAPKVDNATTIIPPTPTNIRDKIKEGNSPIIIAI